jgi:Ran GTPase-activating protein (RanGAP) involved in mRNA processing and transport
VEGLQNFISQNTKLMHLDLSDTGLSEDMILEIVKAVNYSANLIALHLSGNPGLNI